MILKYAIFFVGGMAFGALNWNYARSPVTVSRDVPIQVGDVPDLIRRLKPVTKERYSFLHGNDVQVCFEGDVAVQIKLNMKNNNEYTSKATTLREAAAGLTAPSEEIKAALQGWGQ